MYVLAVLELNIVQHLAHELKMHLRLVAGYGEQEEEAGTEQGPARCPQVQEAELEHNGLRVGAEERLLDED